MAGMASSDYFHLPEMFHREEIPLVWGCWVGFVPLRGEPRHFPGCFHLFSPGQAKLLSPVT